MPYSKESKIFFFRPGVNQRKGNLLSNLLVIGLPTIFIRTLVANKAIISGIKERVLIGIGVIF